MRSRTMVTVVLAVIVACITFSAASASGSTWYCPECGRLNDGNFCPKDATPRPQDLLSDKFDVFSDYYPGAMASLRKFSGNDQRHQSYAGPGSDYSTAGAYKSRKVQGVEAFFEENGYVFVHLSYETVADRYLYFRKNLFSNLPSVPSISEWTYKKGTTISSITPSWGPGSGYTTEKEFVARKNLRINALFKQNDYVYAEYECARGTVRRWLPEDMIEWD